MIYSHELHLFRGGATHFVLLIAKRSWSNLHSLADKQACRLASFDYTPCELHLFRGGATHSVLLFTKRSRSNLHSLADKRACRLASFDYTPSELHLFRGGATHSVLLIAKRSWSNLHSLADKQACRLASFDYREYANIKCCTKFAPRSHHIKRPFSSINWNLTLLQFENLFLYYFFAPSTFVAFRAQQVTCKSSVLCPKSLRIGRHDFVTAILALIGTHADFKLYRIDAQY